MSYLAGGAGGLVLAALAGREEVVGSSGKLENSYTSS